MKRFALAMMSLSLALTMCACSYAPNITELAVPAERVELEIGKSAPLDYTCVTEDQQEGFKAPMFHSIDKSMNIEFESSDSGIVAVDGAGNITGVSPGEAKITVKATNAAGEKDAELKIRCYKWQDDLSSIPESLEVKKGEEMDLAELYESYIRWNALVESEDPDIASADGSVLKAGEPGNTRIALTLGSETRYIDFRSIEMVTGYKLNHDSLEGPADTTEMLEVGEREPENANGGLELTFTSSDEDVATVDDDGTIHFVAPGEAVITAVNELGMETECAVKVTEAVTTFDYGSFFLTLSKGGDANIVDANGKVISSLGNVHDQGDSGKAGGSTNPGSYDRSNPAVAAVLDMVGGSYKCSQIAEAAANAKGATGWVDHGSYSELSPENFLKLGTKVSASQMQPGDILYYANGGAGFSHVAVYIGNGMAVHGNWDLNGKTVIASATYTTLTSVIHID